MASNTQPATADTGLLESIRTLITEARAQVRHTINQAMVQTYWQIGQLIVEHEQQGETRAQYGKAQLKQLSARLTDEFGKGVDVTNLRNMRRFYLAFAKRETLSLELSWSALTCRSANSSATAAPKAGIGRC